MTGKKLFFALSLLLPALVPVDGLAADIKTQSATRYLGRIGRRRPDLNGSVPFSGKAAFNR